MSSLLLWISIFGFTSLAPGFLISLNRSVKSSMELDRLYSLILFLFCFWLILHSFLFFFSSFIQDLTPFWEVFFTVLRMAVSASILWCYGRTSGLLRKNTRPVEVLLYKIIPLLYIFLTSVFIVSENLFLASGITISVSLYMVCISVLGFRSQVIKSDIYYGRFFIISGFYNGLLLVYALSFIFFPRSFVPEIVLRSLFCFALGVNEILRMFHWGRQSTESISADFLDYYKITVRENEVLQLIRKGFPVSRVADQLFISKRTVETHLYNIYAKCRVKNRIELIHLLDNFALRKTT